MGWLADRTLDVWDSLSHQYQRLSRPVYKPITEVDATSHSRLTGAQSDCTQVFNLPKATVSPATPHT